jgi:hypothetical protein
MRRYSAASAKLINVLLLHSDEVSLSVYILFGLEILLISGLCTFQCIRKPNRYRDSLNRPF